MTQSTIDPYGVLGVGRNASDEQIQMAYRRLAKSNHPDLHADASSSARMRRINEAWEVLSSPSLRARYDAESARRTTSPLGRRSASTSGSRPVRAAPYSWSTAWASEPNAQSQTRSVNPSYGSETGWPTLFMIAAIALVMFLGLFVGLFPAIVILVAVLAFARLVSGGL